MIRDLLRRLQLSIIFRPYWQHADELNRHRGMIVAMWAGIESMLDQANHAGWACTHRAISNIVPINFDRKTALFRKIHREIATFTPVADSGLDFLDRVLKHVKERHFLVHGYFVPDKRDRDGWTLRRHHFRKDDGGLDTLERRFTRDELFTLRNDLIDIQNAGVEYINALTVEITKINIQNRND